MSFPARQLPPKMSANAAATCTNCTAVELTEPLAAFVSFQRSTPSLPPTQNVDSAVSHLLAAMQFSGNIAIYAENAATTAISATF